MRQVFTEVFLVAAINSKLMLSQLFFWQSHWKPWESNKVLGIWFEGIKDPRCCGCCHLPNMHTAQQTTYWLEIIGKHVSIKWMVWHAMAILIILWREPTVYKAHCRIYWVISLRETRLYPKVATGIPVYRGKGYPLYRELYMGAFYISGTQQLLLDRLYNSCCLHKTHSLLEPRVVAWNNNHRLCWSTQTMVTICQFVSKHQPISQGYTVCRT